MTFVRLLTQCLYFLPLANASTSTLSSSFSLSVGIVYQEGLSPCSSVETLIEITVSFQVLKPSALSDRHYSEHSCWQIVIKRFVNVEWLKRLQAFHRENQHANCFLCNCCYSDWWIKPPFPSRYGNIQELSFIVMESPVWRISIFQHISRFWQKWEVVIIIPSNYWRHTHLLTLLRWLEERCSWPLPWTDAFLCLYAWEEHGLISVTLNNVVNWNVF